MTSGAEAVLFWCLAPLMVLAGLGLIFARKAVHATMCMVFIMLSLAIMYIANQAPFLGIVQVVVYTGAVMMLFVFVIMLVGVERSESLVETLKGQKWIAWVMGIGLGAIVIAFIARIGLTGGTGFSTPEGATMEQLGDTLLGNFIFPLELVAILLVTSAVAALSMTHKRSLGKRIGQKELADARVLSASRLTPLPSPGVFAQRNAMDVPALDPYGQPVESSVSRVLRARGQERDAINDEKITLLDEAGRPDPSTWDALSSAKGTSEEAGLVDPADVESPDADSTDSSHTAEGKEN